MITTEFLTYPELHKTGCSHIRRLLIDYFDGQQCDKHNRISPEDISGKYVLGSIRNPWDWYVSLWAFGAAGKGAIRNRVETRFDWGYYSRDLPREMGKQILSPAQMLKSAVADYVKPTATWIAAYGPQDEPQRFRRWVKLVLAFERRFDIGEGFAFSPLSQHSGLLTYRYFRLFTLGDQIYSDRRLADRNFLTEFDRSRVVVDGFVRTENLEGDLLIGVQRAGHVVDEETRAQIRKRSELKTNASHRKDAKFYYDSETVDLVADREAFIIEKFGYQWS